MNPFNAIVNQLIAELQAIRDAIAEKQRALASEQQRRASWQQKYDSTTPRRRDPNDLVMVADAQANIDRINSEIAALGQSLQAKEQELNKARAQRDAVDAGAADRMSKGEDPATAYAGSAAEQETKAVINKVIQVALIGLVVVGIAWGIITVVRMRKNK